MIICSIPASIWQRRRYPVHKLTRTFALALRSKLTAIAKFNAAFKSRSQLKLQ
ncbi:MAG: hypothetical protein F6K17_00610, partial [Okeania sp. SIO3C4]|nr:hypothetical protein [Okeania sp. SIO3C4]